MKFAPKLSLTIFLTGIMGILVIASITYHYNRTTVIELNKHQTAVLSRTIANDIDQLLIEKTKTALMLANTPLISEALRQSNEHYAQLPAADRQNTIKFLNMKWMDTKDKNAPFIREYTDNGVARYLREQQGVFDKEYGEIFLTNKFGALVASTSRLSTFAQGHKYWWLGAYSKGAGKVFFDDRGYDDSVAGYVLGVVVPVRDEHGIAGILKCNVNVLGAIDTLLANHNDEAEGELLLVRSGGLIVFGEGTEPLSKQVAPALQETMSRHDNGASIFDIDGKQWMIGFSEISITTNREGYGFGGSAQSVDHKKGNTGESWYILDVLDMNTLLQPTIATTEMMVLFIAFITVLLALVAFFLGKGFARPVTILSDHFESVAQGDFTSRIHLPHKDEFGFLAERFNFMTQELSRTTTSITRLENEIASRKKTEAENEQLIQELQETIAQVKTLRGMLPICSHCKKIRDDQGYWNRIESYIAEHADVEFSHGICPDCLQKYYPDIYEKMKDDLPDEPTRT